ncbi:MAG: enoyl-CoA hydratase/isomerase family protein, partial [Bordetella sp.]|nr:enoyl-CoA hydratase/isomerase family protein [Bordetella sp.]
MADTATGAVQARRHDDLLVLTLDNPPVNALGAAVRRALRDAVTAAQSDPAVAAILILGAGRQFSAGADIREFGQAPQSPSLPEVLDLIEASTKPVFAALHGHALGGGLELALAAHYRVALAGTRLGLP